MLSCVCVCISGFDIHFRLLLQACRGPQQQCNRLTSLLHDGMDWQPPAPALPIQFGCVQHRRCHRPPDLRGMLRCPHWRRATSEPAQAVAQAETTPLANKLPIWFVRSAQGAGLNTNLGDPVEWDRSTPSHPILVGGGYPTPPPPLALFQRRQFSI